MKESRIKINQELKSYDYLIPWSAALGRSVSGTVLVTSVCVRKGLYGSSLDLKVPQISGSNFLRVTQYSTAYRIVTPPPNPNVHQAKKVRTTAYDFATRWIGEEVFRVL